MEVRIVLASWHLRDFNVGLGRYCRGLIEGIGRVDRDNQYVILMPDESYRFPEQPNIRYRLVRFPLFKRRLWEQMVPLLAGSHDLLHFPYDSCVAWKRGRFIATIHDVKQLLFTELCPPRNLNSLIEGIIVGDKWKKIDHVITDSESSCRDIVAKLGISRDRVTVVYPGIDLKRFKPATPADSRIHQRPYVLSVAGADPTKNVQALIEAFIAMPTPVRDAYDLVLVGDFRRRPELRERVADAGIDKQAFFPGVVDDARLIAYYQQATLLVFPSRYEGFGLPVLEAMACGCPVVSSNASSLPEVAGDAAILVEPDDVTGFSREMERVLSDERLRTDLREKGLARAAQFSWDRTARETVAVYRKVIEG
jgi:glycosyltransferase involved in cell wall biosynthesis